MVKRVAGRVWRLWPLAVDLSWIVQGASWAVGVMVAVLVAGFGWFDSWTLLQQIVFLAALVVLASAITMAIVGLVEPLYRRSQRWLKGSEPEGIAPSLAAPTTIVVTPHNPGNGWVHLRVRNKGPRGDFTVKVMYISWPVRSMQWYCAKWREEAPDIKARTIRTGDQGEVDIAYVLTTNEAWAEWRPDDGEKMRYNLEWRRVRLYSTSARPNHYFPWDAQTIDAEVMMDIAVFNEDEIVHRDWYVLRMKNRRDPKGGAIGDLELTPYSAINS